MTWTNHTPCQAFIIYSVWFTNQTTAYTCGFDGQIFKTTNNGLNWAITTPSFGRDLYSIHFADENNGYAVGVYGRTVKTTNGGSTWSELNPVTDDRLQSVFFTDANTGYAVGSEIGGTILKTTNGGGFPVSVTEPVATGATFKLFPNPVNSTITIEIPEMIGNADLSVMNLSGRVVLSRPITGNKTQIDISTLPAGVYFVRVTGDKTVQMGKFVKQ